MYDSNTHSYLYPSSVSGEISNDYYGSSKENIHGYSYKRLYNMKVSGDSGVSSRTGSNYLSSFNYIPFLSEFGNGGVVLHKEKIEIYSLYYPFTKIELDYPDNFPSYVQIKSIDTIISSENKVVILVKTSDNAYYLTLLHTSTGSVATSTLLQQEDSSGTKTSFIPTKIIFELGRAFAIYKNYIVSTDIGDTTIFKNTQGSTDPSKGFTYYPLVENVDVELLDIILSQNHIFIGTSNFYICLDINRNATTTSEIFIQYKVSKEKTSTKKFIEMGGQVLSIGDSYIDVLRFDNFNNTINFHSISSTINYMLDGQPITKVASRFYQSNLVLYIIKGTKLHRITVIVNENNIPISLSGSTYFSSPYTKQYPSSQYISFSPNNLLSIIKYKSIYYLNINSVLEDSTRAIKNLCMQDSTIYNDQYKKVIQQTDYLDFSVSKNSLINHLCEIYTSTQLLIREKLTVGSIVKDDLLLLQYNNDKGIITYYKASVFDVKYSSLGTIISFTFDFSTLQNINSITGDTHPILTRIVGCLTNNTPTNISHLDDFYNSNFVYIKYLNEQGVFETKQILSKYHLNDSKLDKTLYCRIGIGYRSFVELLPSFDGRASVIPTGLKAVISNATKSKLYTLTLTDTVDGIENTDIMSYMNNYSDEELAESKVLFQYAINYIPKLYELQFSSPSTSNVTFVNMFIGASMGYSFKLHSYILVGS